MGDEDKLSGAKKSTYPKLTDESSEEEPGTTRGVEKISSEMNAENKVLGGSFTKTKNSQNNMEMPNIPVKSPVGPPKSNKTLQKKKTAVPDFESLRGMNGVRAIQAMNKVLLGFIPKNFMEIPNNPAKSQSQSIGRVQPPLFNYTFTPYRSSLPVSININSSSRPGTSTQQISDEDDCIIVDEIPAKDTSCPVQPNKRDLNVEKSASRSSPSFCASSLRCEIARDELRRVPSSSESEYSEPTHCPMLCFSSCTQHHQMQKSRDARKMEKKLMKDKSRRKRISYKTYRRRSKTSRKGHAKKKKQGEPGSSSSSSSSSSFSDSSTSSSSHSSPGPASRRRLFSSSSSPSSSPDRHIHNFLFKNIGLQPKKRKRSRLTKSRNGSNQQTKVPAESLSKVTNKDHLHDNFVPFGVKNIEKPLERSNSFTTRGLAHIECDNTSDVGIAVKHMDSSPADVHKMVVAPVLPLKCRTVTNRWSPERCASLISLNNPTKSCICEHAHMLNFAAREVVQKSISFTIPAPNVSLVPNRN